MTIEPREVLSLVSDADLLVEVRRRNLLGKPAARECGWCSQAFVLTGRNQRYCTPEHRRRAALMRAGRVPSLATIARESERSRKKREAYNAYAREYQREWRKTRTPEQVERHRQQQRAWYERKKESAA